MSRGSLLSWPLNEHFGTELGNVDLSQDDNDTALFGLLRELLWDRLLLVVRNQRLEPDRLMAVAQAFGNPSPCVDPRFALPGYPDIALVGNWDNGDGRAMQVNGQIEWHYDYAHTPTPALVSLLYGVVVPLKGGDTLYADTRSAYAALSNAEQARARDALATYSNDRLNALLDNQDDRRVAADAPDLPQVTRHLAEEHPVTRRPALLFAPELLVRLEGASIDEANAMVERATSPEFVYRHQWRTNDLLICDNRSTVHTATPIEDRTVQRLIYRIAVSPDVAYPES